MSENKIQTLHPTPGKNNKLIDKHKYDTIRNTMLEVLSKDKLTHTQLMEAMYEILKDDFKGNVQWYGEAVKLDLEARGIVGRTNDKPQRYFII
jgi:hypothetical protein